MAKPSRTFDKMRARALLDAQGKSYADLGRALGLERQTVGHWFRDRGEPSVQQLKGMADELGVHWLELVTDEATVVFQDEERARLERIRALSPEALAMLDAFLAGESPKKPN